ncbi:MAG: hypothetical protein QOJ53_1136 [Sphingomonadales bacterium]|jgi:hypothetical protein|nr:hypothetical protein [Sphingomonadales bacterium]
MIRRGLVVLAALAMLGCSEPAPPPAASAPAVRLSSQNPDANAAAIAALFRRTCIDAGADAGAFAAALQASGWAPEQLQGASTVMPIAAWRLSHGEIVRSELSIGPGVGVVDCELRLDADVSPSLERMRDTLRPLLGQPSLREVSAGPPQVKWRWRANEREERDLTIEFAAAGQSGNAMQGRPGLVLHYGSAQAPPAPPVPAETDNLQSLLNEIGNVH